MKKCTKAYGTRGIPPESEQDVGQRVEMRLQKASPTGSTKGVTWGSGPGRGGVAREGEGGLVFTGKRLSWRAAPNWGTHGSVCQSQGTGK